MLPDMHYGNAPVILGGLQVGRDHHVVQINDIRTLIFQYPFEFAQRSEHPEICLDAFITEQRFVVRYLPELRHENHPYAQAVEFLRQGPVPLKEHHRLEQGTVNGFHKVEKAVAAASHTGDMVNKQNPPHRSSGVCTEITTEAYSG